MAFLAVNGHKIVLRCKLFLLDISPGALKHIEELDDETCPDTTTSTRVFNSRICYSNEELSQLSKNIMLKVTSRS